MESTCSGLAALYDAGRVHGDVRLGYITDPNGTTWLRELDVRHQRNSEWLQVRWADFLPSARGKFFAVAQETGIIVEWMDQSWDAA